jgi:hypothetical protein
MDMSQLAQMIGAQTQFGQVQDAIGRQQQAIAPVSQQGQTLTGMFNQAYPGIEAGMWGPTGYDPSSAVTAGRALESSVSAVPGYMGQMGQMAFDPQQELYNRTAQQLQDQVRSAESARGIAMTPYGAGVEGKTMSDFNIDWQNNLLSRALQGAQGIGSLEGTYGKGLAGGQELQMAGPNFQTGLLSSLLGAGREAVAPYISAAELQGKLTGAQQNLANAWIDQMNQMIQNQQQQQRYQDQQQMSALGGLGSLFGTGMDFLSSGTKPWIFS